MIKKENLDKTSAWPFVEAKKMLRERKSFIEKKGKITLQTGYGPSGLPHIGTFGEVARTSMIVNALKHLTDLPTEIITFSDDMDGLRKVPDNVPKKDLLEKNLSETNYSLVSADYSLKDKQIIETIFGLNYNKDCWIFSFTYHKLASAFKTLNIPFLLTAASAFSS